VIIKQRSLLIREKESENKLISENKILGVNIGEKKLLIV